MNSDTILAKRILKAVENIENRVNSLADKIDAFEKRIK